MFSTKYFNVIVVVALIGVTPTHSWGMQQPLIEEVKDHGITHTFSPKNENSLPIVSKNIKVYKAPFCIQEKKGWAFPIDKGNIAVFDGSKTTVWDIVNNQKYIFQNKDDVSYAVLAVLTKDIIILGGVSSNFLLWDFKNDKIIASYQNPNSEKTIIAATTIDEKTVAVVNTSGTVYLWDIQQNKCIQKVPGTPTHIDTIIPISNTKIVAAHKNLDKFTISDLKTKKCISLDQHKIFQRANEGNTRELSFYGFANTVTYMKITGLAEGLAQDFVLGYHEIVQDADEGNDFTNSNLCFFNAENLKITCKLEFSEKKRAVFPCFIKQSPHNILMFGLKTLDGDLEIRFLDLQDYSYLKENIDFSSFLKNNSDEIAVTKYLQESNMIRLITRKGFIIDIGFTNK